jgi:acetylxylan esterase
VPEHKIGRCWLFSGIPRSFSADFEANPFDQGAEIEDNALCGGGDFNQGYTNTATLISTAASKQIKVVIWAGNPRNSPYETFHYGSCTAGGVSNAFSTLNSLLTSKQFDARPAGFSCPTYQSLIRSYCDASDPYCCNGNNAATHQGYGNEYGQNALAFVKSKLG